MTAMARPSGLPWTLGKVTTKQHPTIPGKWQARGYYNDGDNRRREVTASGDSPTKAVRALQAKVTKASTEYRGGDATLNQSTRVGKAVEVWLDHAGRKRGPNGKRLAENTLVQYQGNADRYVSGSSIEHLTLAQANDVARIERWLAEIADQHGEGASVSARTVLSNTLRLAERQGAIHASVMHRAQRQGASKGSKGDRKCSDPDCDFDCGKRHLDTGRAFTADEFKAVRKAAQISNADLADLVEFLFVTGARIREALHCVAWTDVDLEARTVHIRGTKTKASDRVVMLNEDLADVLARRKEAHGGAGLVFGVTRYESKAGQPRDVNNVLRSLRDALGEAGCGWAGSHTFRRTVATWMDEAGVGLAEIASQLGHANTAVTTRYLARKVAPTRAASIMTVAPEAPLLTIVREGVGQ